MAQRIITSGKSSVRAWDVTTTNEDLHTWLTDQATQHGLTWLLAYCEDGTIWGVMQGDRLLLSSDAFPQGRLGLRWAALSQARLFGPQGELLLWQGPAGWRARLRDDSAGDDIDYIDERQLLWGTWSGEPDRTVPPFTLLVEGRQGIQHAPPATRLGEGQHARLRVRHYLVEDKQTGVVQIIDSRMVALIDAGIELLSVVVIA